MSKYTNKELNDFVFKFANYDNDDEDAHLSTGKRVPYIGWFWRYTDFICGRIRIGNCGKFIGVMENNKWGYSQRLLTPDEADTVLQYVEVAYELHLEGNDDAAISKLNELWDVFQTFELEFYQDWDEEE